VIAKPCNPGLTLTLLLGILAASPHCQAAESTTHLTIAQACYCKRTFWQEHHQPPCTAVQQIITRQKMSRSSQQLQINCTSRNPWSKAFTQHAPVVHACPRAASTLVSARLSLAAAAVKAELQDQHTHQHIQQQWQQAFPVVSSKRQLLAFGCACCLSLQAQQQLPAAADSGQFTYAGAQTTMRYPLCCIWCT
jgi:hypothetical protein